MGGPSTFGRLQKPYTNLDRKIPKSSANTDRGLERERTGNTRHLCIVLDSSGSFSFRAFTIWASQAPPPPPPPPHPTPPHPTHPPSTRLLQAHQALCANTPKQIACQPGPPPPALLISPDHCRRAPSGSRSLRANTMYGVPVGEMRKLCAPRARYTTLWHSNLHRAWVLTNTFDKLQGHRLETTLL